jgi:hypothetical protein
MVFADSVYDGYFLCLSPLQYLLIEFHCKEELPLLSCLLFGHLFI